MTGVRTEIEDAADIDELYPQTELEFLSRNAVQDPLVVKVSELIYRQCQKAKQREKQKKSAMTIAMVVCCLFFSLMMAYVVARKFEDNDIIKRANAAMNTTIYERIRNESLAQNTSNTGGLTGLLQTFHANVISPYIKNATTVG